MVDIKLLVVINGNIKIINKMNTVTEYYEDCLNNLKQNINEYV